LSETFVRGILAAELAPGGMKAVELYGREIVICNVDGRFLAVDRRCGHMNAPLERGTLDGSILTCAFHCVQFDVTTGEPLSGPINPYLGGEIPGPRTAAYFTYAAALMENIHTQPIRTYPVKVEQDWVMVAI
jgi:nitrite reductase/ring-hydroxylating ferredoxin subunit